MLYVVVAFLKRNKSSKLNEFKFKKNGEGSFLANSKKSNWLLIELHAQRSIFKRQNKDIIYSLFD